MVSYGVALLGMGLGALFILLGLGMRQLAKAPVVVDGAEPAREPVR